MPHHYPGESKILAHPQASKYNNIQCVPLLVEGSVLTIIIHGVFLIDLKISLG